MNFDWQAGYPSTRVPVFARNIVSTSHPLGAQAGLRMIERGGNAVDAAIAAAATMTIVEPCSNGLGSDAFALVWDGAKLDTWLQGPKAMVPGTKMVFMGVKDPKDRTDLIAYLMTQTK